MGEREVDRIDEAILSAIAVACNLDRSSITVDASMLDLGVDSVTLIAIIAQIQARFDVHIGENELVELFDAPLVREFIAIVRRAQTSG